MIRHQRGRHHDHGEVTWRKRIGKNPRGAKEIFNMPRVPYVIFNWWWEVESKLFVESGDVFSDGVYYCAFL